MMAKLDRATSDELARGVMRHLEYHTAYLEPATGFQFALPEGRFLTVMDYRVKNTRVLWFFGRAPANPYRRVSTTLVRPRRLPREGAWFVGYSERRLRRALRTIDYAVGFAFGSAYGGADTDREPRMILLDPLGPLETVERPQPVEGGNP
jgi:hypothetical protein